MESKSTHVPIVLKTSLEFSGVGILDKFFIFINLRMIQLSQGPCPLWLKTGASRGVLALAECFPASYNHCKKNQQRRNQYKNLGPVFQPGPAFRPGGTISGILYAKDYPTLDSSPFCTLSVPRRSVRSL